MNNSALGGKVIAMIALAVCLHGQAKGQAIHAPHQAFKIEGFTDVMRDALAKDLERDGHFRIAFACVPAGVLVLEPVASGPDVGTGRMSTLLDHRIERSSIRTANMDLRSAEALCAEARTR